MHEAIGEPIATSQLALAFAHADLRFTAPWKAQLDAAERLARHGAVSENVLLRHYTSRTPAASGGVWDRAAAVQRFDVAMLAGDVDAIADTLPAAWSAMRATRAEIQFAKLYGAALHDMPLRADVAPLAVEVGLLSPAYERVALASLQREAGVDPFLIGLARGVPEMSLASGPSEVAVANGFATPGIPDDITRLLDEDKLGEALLVTLRLFHAGTEGDLRSLTSAIGVLRTAGLEDVARRASLQYLLLNRTI
jgi:hypothetical protein